jgi:hypothetical membrane protein
MGPTIIVLSSWFFAAQVLVAWVFRPQYSFVSNVISDLGNTACTSSLCSPHWVVWDVSVGILGLALMVGSFLIFSEFSFSKHRRERRAALAGFVCLLLAGFGAVLVGAVPENKNWVHLHTVGTAVAIGFGQLGILVLGLVLRQIPDWLREFMIVTSLLVLLAGISIAGKHQFGIGAGALERLAQYPESVWLILFGFYISRDHYRNGVIKSRGFAFSGKRPEQGRTFRSALSESVGSVRRSAPQPVSPSPQPPPSAPALLEVLDRQVDAYHAELGAILLVQFDGVTGQIDALRTKIEELDRRSASEMMPTDNVTPSDGHDPGERDHATQPGEHDGRAAQLPDPGHGE